jgi:hypothetical protein
MSSSISFAEFRAAAAAADPLRDKALLFVYRALEDFAAELRAAPSAITVLDISPDARGFATALVRWGARVRSIAPRDVASVRDTFDVVILDRVLLDDELLQRAVSALDTVGMMIAVVPNRGRRTTAGRLERRFGSHGLSVHRLMNAGFVSPPVRALRTFDADFSDLVPHWMASGWLVALRRRRT